MYISLPICLVMIWNCIETLHSTQESCKELRRTYHKFCTIVREQKGIFRIVDFMIAENGLDKRCACNWDWNCLHGPGLFTCRDHYEVVVDCNSRQQPEFVYSNKGEGFWELGESYVSLFCILRAVPGTIDAIFHLTAYKVLLLWPAHPHRMLSYMLRFLGAR